MSEVSKAEQALKLLDGAEQSCPGAIEELLAQREEIDAKLARLKRLAGAQPSVKSEKKKPKPCAVCGATDHDGRFHRGDKNKADVVAMKA